MQKSIQLSEGKRRLLAVVALSASVGIVSAALNTGAIGLFPPKLKSGDLAVAAASTHVFIDSPPPSVVHRREYPVSELIRRGELLGRLMTSPPALERIGRRSGVPPDLIAASAHSTASVPRALTEPGSEQRASDIQREGLPYKLEVQARQTTPIIDVFTQAPSTAEAKRLADAAVSGLDDYLRGSPDRQRFAQGGQLRLRQLGRARGGLVNAGIPVAIAILTFIVAFALSCGALLYLIRRRDRGRASPGMDPPTHDVDLQAGDDWPRTTRLLPWMLAGFIAILWLLPFNDIELRAQLPIDLKLDRLVLPFVAATWALALAVGGRVAPRVRFTRIHAAVAAFLVCAFVSVILGARELSRTLELDSSLKQLPLLVSYVSLFAIAASVVRRSEIRAFLLYTLLLAVACAVGIVWEYRFKQNLFYDWSDKLLPGIFSVGDVDAGAVDDIGRRFVRGPAGLPLEAVAMLSMALPVAIVSAMHAKPGRDRALYGLAACLLLAASFATYRKSTLLAPVSVILTVAYFRRRELLKLSPLALVLVVLVHVLAPGAIGKTTGQFDPAQLGVTTVSDRSADYDAIRPDLWTHLVFGRGWGSYDWVTYRILDSELLHRTLEIGVLGLLAYVFMVLSVIGSARATIASRDPRWAPLALMGAAAAVSFLVVSTLFDVLAFPHATYIFLYMAGLVAVGAERRRDPDAAAIALHGLSGLGADSRPGAVRRPEADSGAHAPAADPASSPVAV